MGDVVQFQTPVTVCFACEETMKQDELGNFRCKTRGCGAGRITSPTGVRVIRKNGYTIIEPKGS